MEWEAYDQIEPIGGYRQDYRIAQLCQLLFEIAQAALVKKGRRRKSKIADFMPWGPEKKELKKKQSVEEIKTKLLGVFAKIGKKKNV